MTMTYTIIFMMVVGGAIGAATNFLAIKMLFRPLKPLYLGKRKIPFTPGIIPKRRGEMATQLGKTVSDYLLTSDGIKAKLENEKVRSAVKKFVTEKVNNEIEKKRSFQEYVTMASGLSEKKTLLYIEEKLLRSSSESLMNYIEKNKNLSLKEMIPQDIHDYLDGEIPVLAQTIVLNTEKFIMSEEGKEKIDLMMHDAFKERKFIGSVLQTVMKNDTVTTKVRTELIKWIQSDGFKYTVLQIIEKEWDKVKSKNFGELTQRIKKEDVRRFTQKEVLNKLPISAWLNRTFYESLKGNQSDVLNQKVNAAVDFGLDYGVSHVEFVLGKVNLSEMVEQQVNTFEVERLEQLVLGIIKKELKMITFLGGALGAIIGLIQGLIVMTTL